MTFKGIIVKCFCFSLYIFMIIIFSSCQKVDKNEVIEIWKVNRKFTKQFIIKYPKDGTMFPPEIVSPTFVWENGKKPKVEDWAVIVENENNEEILRVFISHKKWRPTSSHWEIMKKNSVHNNIHVRVLGLKKAEVVLATSISIKTSADQVGAPIFYRDVPLPFSYAVKHPDEIRWRLGEISSNEPAKIMMEKLLVCGNCHSFTRDGQTLAMDIDYANDKGSYAISKIDSETVLSMDKIITWSDFRRDEKEPTFGLLSQISPDGRYVVSTVKDRSIFVAVDHDIAYSQLFFPIKGIVAVYDREQKKFWELPGADDPNYCQSNPTWAHNGKYIVFAREKVYRNKKIEQYEQAILPTEMAKEFLDGKKEFKYDLYRIPFNNGKGGEAEPIVGASNNGMSNFFPKISPDGKWMVFTQAKNFMLLQPDSRLYIMPVRGGLPREMTCNTETMNSWHSWSPNSKWLVFASKPDGPYTKLYLTHIDENGNDTPPVLLENFDIPKRSINIPEFVNIDKNNWAKIVENFMDDSNYYIRVADNEAHFGNFEKAMEAYGKAEKRNSKDPNLYNNRGTLKIRMGNYSGALADLDKANQFAPEDPKVLSNIAVVKYRLNDYKGALKYLDRTLLLNQNDIKSFGLRGAIKAYLNDFKGSIKDFNRVLKEDPKDSNILLNRAISKTHVGDFKGALTDLKKSTEIEPTNYKAQLYRGNIAFQLGFLDEALAAYTNAIIHNPDDFRAHFQRANLNMQLKDFTNAIDDYNNAILLNPKYGQGYFFRGTAKIKLGDKNDGCLDLQKALSLGYEDARNELKKNCQF